MHYQKLCFIKTVNASILYAKLFSPEGQSVRRFEHVKMYIEKGMYNLENIAIIQLFFSLDFSNINLYDDDKAQCDKQSISIIMS